MKLRKRPRVAHASIDESCREFDQSGHHAKSIRRWRRSPDEQMIREECRSLVRECIDRLPDDYRSVLLLRDVEDLHTEETASILGTSPGTVKTRLHRARLAFAPFWSRTSAKAPRLPRRFSCEKRHAAGRLGLSVACEKPVVFMRTLAIVSAQVMKTLVPTPRVQSSRQQV